MSKENEESQWQQTSVTLYSYMCNHQDFFNYLVDAMKEVNDGIIKNVEQISENQVKITLFDGSPVVAHVTSDLNEVKKQGNGMVGFFMRQKPLENKDVMNAAFIQMQNFKYIVGIQFFVNDNDDRTNCLYDIFFSAAEKAGAFVLTRSMALMDHEGKVLIDTEGNTDFEEFYPMADKNSFNKVEEDECDKERRERSLAVVRELGLPFIEKKAVSIAENKCEIVSKEDLIHRLACVFTACACADTCVNSPKDAPEDVVNFRNMFDERFNISQYTSEYEGRYIADPINHARYHDTHLWRYECCSVFLWALGLTEIDEYPTGQCDAGEICQLMFHNDFDSLCAKANMRSKEEILDKLDLIYRINWACVDAQVKHQRVTVVDAAVVYFWHYALNWIAGVDGVTNWDAVRPNT